VGVGVDEQHPHDVSEHKEQHEDRYDVDQHTLVLPRNAVSDAIRSARVVGTISRRRRRRSD